MTGRSQENKAKDMLSEADCAPLKYLPLRFVLQPLTEAQRYLVFWISDVKNEHLLLGNILNLFVGQSLIHLWPCFWCDTALHGRLDPATPQLPCTGGNPCLPMSLLTFNPLGVVSLHWNSYQSSPFIAEESSSSLW